MKAKTIKKISEGFMDDDSDSKAMRSWMPYDPRYDDFNKTVVVDEPFSITFDNSEEFAKLTLLLAKYKIPFKETEEVMEGTTPQYKKLIKRAKALGIESGSELMDLIGDEFDDEDAIISGADYETAKKALKLNEILKFSDGMEFDTDGELRTEEREDGWYVIGKGMLIPVDTEEEGQTYINRFKPRTQIDGPGARRPGNVQPGRIR